MAYTDIDKPSDYFNTVLRSGLYGGSDTAFTVGFQPDLIWDKRRSDTSVHALFDSSRGFGSSGKVLYSNTTAAEGTNALIKSVSSTGFTVTASSDNTGTLVDWCWKKQAGIFDIVTYTGNGSNRTISHNLGAVPTMMVTKVRSTTNQWLVYHQGIGNTNTVKIDDTSAATTQTNLWNSTTPTSSVFSVGTHTGSNLNGGTFVMYLFGDKQGVSKMGSYTGNGNADGTFVYTGFKPAFLLWKLTTAAGYGFQLVDSKRNTFNPVNSLLFPYETHAEYTNASEDLDLLSNGFKIRNSDRGRNGSGDNYIYMAFAENPFVTSTGVPATAR